MDSAQELFNTLADFKRIPQTSHSPQQLLFEYCNEILGSVERLRFDYKEKRNRSTAELEDTDRTNLAKAVSGFANSSGGVLIWGIKDQDLTPKPIANIERFTEILGRLAWQATDPPVRDIEMKWIPADLPDTTSGFALIYIPESALPPHRVILNISEVKNHYYIRTAESFIVAPHVQLEDMFGRRPKPVLSLATRIEVQENGTKPNFTFSYSVILGIRNEGRGIAKTPFMSIEVNSPYAVSRHGLDGNHNNGLKELTTSPQVKARKYGASADIVVYPGVVHDVTSIAIDLHGRDLEDMQNLVIDWKMIADGVQLVEDQVVITGEDLKDAIKTYVGNKIHA